MDHNPQAPLSMGFSRQEYWSGLPCPPPGEKPVSDPGIEPVSLRSPVSVDSLSLALPGKPINSYIAMKIRTLKKCSKFWRNRVGENTTVTFLFTKV